MLCVVPPTLDVAERLPQLHAPQLLRPFPRLGHHERVADLQVTVDLTVPQERLVQAVPVALGLPLEVEAQ